MNYWLIDTVEGDFSFFGSLSEMISELKEVYLDVEILRLSESILAVSVSHSTGMKDLIAHEYSTTSD